MRSSRSRPVPLSSSYLTLEPIGISMTETNSDGRRAPGVTSCQAWVMVAAPGPLECRKRGCSRLHPGRVHAAGQLAGDAIEPQGQAVEHAEQAGQLVAVEVEAVHVG